MRREIKFKLGRIMRREIKFKIGRIEKRNEIYTGMDWEREKSLNGVQRFHKTFHWFAAITQCFFSGSWYRNLSGGWNVLDPSRMGTVGYQGGVQKYWGYIINLLIIIINGRTFREDFLGRIGSPWGGGLRPVYASFYHNIY